MFTNTVRPTKVAAVVGSRASGASARPTVMLPDPAEAVTHLWAEGTDADTAQTLLDEWAAVVEQAGQ